MSALAWLRLIVVVEFDVGESRSDVSRHLLRYWVRAVVGARGEGVGAMVEHLL